MVRLGGPAGTLELGVFSLSLNVGDLDASRRFYEALAGHNIEDLDVRFATVASDIVERGPVAIEHRTRSAGKPGAGLVIKDAIADITLQQVLTRAKEFDVIATLRRAIRMAPRKDIPAPGVRPPAAAA